MNAFCHADLRIAGPVMVKLYLNQLEISDNVSFVAGITRENIRQHQLAARNPFLVEAMFRLCLVNHSNLGINRMFFALLNEGREPPHIREIGESVSVGFPKRDLNIPFCLFVAEESGHQRKLGVDELLLLQYLLQHPALVPGTAAALCQRGEPQIRERLSRMESAGCIEHGGKGRGTYWCIYPDMHNCLTECDQGEARRRIDWETAKTRVLSILNERARRGEPGLSNKDIRQVTHFNLNLVHRLMTLLRQEDHDLQPPVTGNMRDMSLRMLASLKTALDKYNACFNANLA